MTNTGSWLHQLSELLSVPPKLSQEITIWMEEHGIVWHIHGWITVLARGVCVDPPIHRFITVLTRGVSVGVGRTDAPGQLRAEVGD